MSIFELGAPESQKHLSPSAAAAIAITYWPLGDLDVILKMWSSILLYLLVSSNLLMMMSSDECHRTLLMISQHCFRWWLGAVRQQAITWTSVDQDLKRHKASLGPNEWITRPWSIHQKRISTSWVVSHTGYIYTKERVGYSAEVCRCVAR